MRLRYIAQVSFQSSEATNFQTFSRKNPELVKRLSETDVIAFVSLSGDQLVFIHGFTEIDGEKGALKVLSSRRLRMTGGTWNPLRLANYAEEAGLQLDGLKKFEKYYAELAQ